MITDTQIYEALAAKGLALTKLDNTPANAGVTPGRALADALNHPSDRAAEAERQVAAWRERQRRYRELESGNVMWGWVAGGIVLALLLVFVFGRVE
jgi:uncharacterized membrane protein YdbT with pleckstrin-like domain